MLIQLIYNTLMNNYILFQQNYPKTPKITHNKNNKNHTITHILYIYTYIQKNIPNQQNVNRQQMNRILLSQIQQLKCNFCTQWFSVTTQYANLQQYSLNVCQKCLHNFKYQIIDHTTYQIYDVVLIKTGIELINKSHINMEKFQMYMKIHRDLGNITEGQSTILKQQHIKNNDLKAQNNMYTQPIKQHLSEIYKNFISGIINKWHQILTQLQKTNNQFDRYKDKIINILSDRYYNFNKDVEKLLDVQKIENKNKYFNEICQENKKITSQSMLDKIKKYIGEYFGICLQNNMENNQQNDSTRFRTENKQNKTPNDKNKLKIIRQKFMKNSRSSRCQNNNQLKISSSVLIKNSSTKSIKSSKKDTHIYMNKSSQSSLLKPQSFQILKKDKSQKSLKPSTPRTYHYQFQNLETQKTNSIIDQYRDKISKLIKQTTQFQSYMPIQLHKNQSIVDKTFGQKCMIQYIVQLKMKTTLNNNICQLINQNLTKCNISCYLRSLQWNNSITLIRFVKVKMYDRQFDWFLNWLSDKNFVQIVVVTNNFLTEFSLEALYAFCVRHRYIGLRQVYMGNNYIKPSKAKKIIQALKAINIYVYI